MLLWMNVYTRQDRNNNECIREKKLRVVIIVEKMV